MTASDWLPLLNNFRPCAASVAWANLNSVTSPRQGWIRLCEDVRALDQDTVKLRQSWLRWLLAVGSLKDPDILPVVVVEIAKAVSYGDTNLYDAVTKAYVAVDPSSQFLGDGDNGSAAFADAVSGLYAEAAATYWPRLLERGQIDYNMRQLDLGGLRWLTRIRVPAALATLDAFWFVVTDIVCAGASADADADTRARVNLEIVSVLEKHNPYPEED